ncbi:DUF1878 family protein [Sutcliffiella rhizosphaerae]|uniref:DUF1878 family protein n=1 Tax=Sutcliffiella rhizosphaerae TaxID=2880967 RepID=A0ABN8ABH0_9BACI|nr:DUF1878 family protein [Sutcliffiella rhizosphaerae]CAG9622539.1 putative protein YhaI [Sutcliffiella rhizosphaerae]
MLEDRLSALEYHLELLVKQMDRSKYPLDYIIIRGNLSREDVQSLFSTCEKLSIEMEKQKAEGFVTFTPLLNEFRHAIHPSLNLDETINALHIQGKFVPLMEAFQRLTRK